MKSGAHLPCPKGAIRGPEPDVRSSRLVLQHVAWEEKGQSSMDFGQVHLQTSCLVLWLQLLPVAPVGMCLDAFGVNRDTQAVLLAVVPLTSVDAAVRPDERALAVLHVPLIAALVLGPVGPLHLPDPAHVAAHPLARVHAAVLEAIASFPLHLVLLELPLIMHACGRSVDPDAVLGPTHELPLVAGAVGPVLDAPARLLVVVPLALVGTSVNMDVLAVPVCSVLVPLALVDVAVGGRIDPVAVRLRV
mmetsp:Transcript_110510/g.312596  ORF Transcript_110510/g.312596 Transcript_110510/m.312596 type:complete len:247 (+) Transcript_110510:65-805(+)